MSAHPNPADRPLDGIVIGASAGGVEVLGRLLPALPATLAAAVFVVLHQPPDRPSVLVDIFRDRCAVKVCEAEDKQPVQAGTVYFAPPNYHLLVESGPRIALSVDDLVQFSRPSIDVLFQSAADAYGERLLAILLTGWNEDGAAGIKAVHAAGGITVVQDPDTAEAAAMPRAAIRQVQPHFVLDTAAIEQLLRGLAAAPSAFSGSPAP